MLVAASFPVSCCYGEQTMSKSVIVQGEKAARTSYGESIEQADLVVIGDYNQSGTVTIKEVLKGDAKMVGKTIRLVSPITMGCRVQPVPTIANACVLLSCSASEKGKAIDIFDTPEEIEALKVLVPIYGISSEHTRLKKLSELFISSSHADGSVVGNKSERLKREFLWAITQMREPANFTVVSEVYFSSHLSQKDKLSLQEWIGLTLDPRAVPILVAALATHDRFLVSDALVKLIFYYPGKATDSALQTMLKNCTDENKPSIVRYLTKRRLLSANSREGQIQQSPIQKAVELDQQGKWQEALPVFLSILESNETNGYIIRTAASRVLEQGDKSSRARLAKARTSWFVRDASTNNYLEAQDTARILRKLAQPDALAGLLAIMRKRDWLFASSNRVATMAVLELGPASRKKVLDELIKDAHSPELASKQDEQIRLLLALAWIKQKSDSEPVSNISKIKGWASSFDAIHPLLNGLPASDEGKFLIDLLLRGDNSTPLSPEVKEWIVFRLGDLKDARAADVLIELFEKSPSSANATMAEALIAIGGESIAKRLESIARDKKSNHRAEAVEILTSIRKEKSLPTLRELLHCDNLDTKVRALSGIGMYGGCADYAAIRAMANYWKGDRKLHYWIVQALSQIDDRCNCTLGKQ